LDKPTRCLDGARRPLGNDRVAYAAIVRGHAVAYHAPRRLPFARFGRLNVNGVPTVFSVVGEIVDSRCAARWYHVELPLRPNGTTGWVRARDVWVEKVQTKLLVDLSERRVFFYRNGRLVLHAPVAIGTRATPTPRGRYYVNQRLVPSNPRGPYGPGAIGISAFSNVLTGWAQGGPVAIHGTNEPWLIGRAVSNGCIRVRNDVLRRLFRAVPAGTPVIIRA
jgi:hypothetical protein